MHSCWCSWRGDIARSAQHGAEAAILLLVLTHVGHEDYLRTALAGELACVSLHLCCGSSLNSSEISLFASSDTEHGWTGRWWEQLERECKQKLEEACVLAIRMQGIQATFFERTSKISPYQNVWGFLYMLPHCAPCNKERKSRLHTGPSPALVSFWQLLFKIWLSIRCSPDKDKIFVFQSFWLETQSLPLK